MMIKFGLESKRGEILWVSLIAIGFILYFYRLLFTAERMLSHDSIWFYGIFHYFAESLQSGFFPYWDPYDYCGQPFYNIVSTMYILNPITILVIFIGKLFGTNLLTLYHWHFIIKLLMVNLGVYLCLRQVTKNRLSALLVLLVFSFSSFTFASLRQSGMVYTLSWLPWAIWFFLRLLDRRTLLNIVGFACFTGMCLIAYQGLLVAVFLVLFIPSFLINERRFFRDLISSRRGLGLLLVFIMILGAFSLHGLSLYFGKDEFTPMARVKTSPSKQMEFDDPGGGKSSKPMDFVSLVNPRLASKGYFQRRGIISEGFLYIGILPLMFVFVGLFMGKGRWKGNFIYITCMMVLLMLDQGTGIKRIIDIIFPPFRYVRHTFLFSGFFLFCLAYFMGKGVDYIIGRFTARKWKTVTVTLIFLIAMADLLAYGSQTFDHVTLKRTPVNFDKFRGDHGLTGLRRQQRVVAKDLIRYYKPILYKEPSVLNACTVTEHYDKGILSQGLYGAYREAISERPSDFNKNAAELTVRELIPYGFSKFQEWDNSDQQAFLELAYIIVLDVLMRSDFYSAFDKIGGVLAYLRRSTLAGIGQKRAGNSVWPGKEKAEELLTGMLDLRFKIRPGYRGKTFVWIRKPYSFRQMVMMHNSLFKQMPAAQYLGYTWAKNHSEEFTIVQYKQYKEMLDLLKEAGEDKAYAIEKAINRFTGVDADIIRFFSSCTFAPRDDIIKAILADPRADLLYLEPDTRGNEPDLDEDIQIQSGYIPAGFKYEIVEYSPNKIRIEIESPGNGYLYFSDGYDRHWRATVDGLPADIYRANLAFKAIEVPVGSHIVTFTYLPQLFRLSLIFYYLMIAGFLILALFVSRRKI